MTMERQYLMSFCPLMNVSSLVYVSHPFPFMMIQLILINYDTENRDTMFTALNIFGSLKGFYPTIRNGAIRCNRYGDKEYMHNYTGGGLQYECTFFNIQARSNPKKVPKNATAMSNKKKNQYSPDYSSHIKIMQTHGIKNPFHHIGIIVDCVDHLLGIL